MFSTGHLIWVCISFVLIAGGLFYCLKNRPSLRRVLSISMVLGVISEVIKVFSVSKIVPMVVPSSFSRTVKQS